MRARGWGGAHLSMPAARVRSAPPPYRQTPPERPPVELAEFQQYRARWVVCVCSEGWSSGQRVGQRQGAGGGSASPERELGPSSSRVGGCTWEVGGCCCWTGGSARAVRRVRAHSAAGRTRGEGVGGVLGVVGRRVVPEVVGGRAGALHRCCRCGARCLAIVPPPPSPPQHYAHAAPHPVLRAAVVLKNTSFVCVCGGVWVVVSAGAGARAPPGAAAPALVCVALAGWLLRTPG